MSVKYSILIEQLEVFISSKNQIDRILYDYENEIKNIVNKIKKYDPSVDNIYEFDRQDEESVFYLIKEIIENKNFLNYG